MWWSLLLPAEASTINEGVNERYLVTIQEVSLGSTAVDENESDAQEAKGGFISQYWNSSIYGHPDFERAHHLTTLGKKVRMVSGTVAVGSGLVAWTAWANSASCKGPDCGPSGWTAGLGPVVVASLGGVGYLTGTGLTLLGNSSAHSVLKTKGVEVSNAGIITSGIGFGLGSMLILDTIVLGGGSGWYREALLASLCAVPLGFYVQQRINKKAYMGFVDEFSLAPIWTPDTTGVVLQAQF